MKISIDTAAGFCPGVRNAIKMAEKELDKGNGLASLGSLLHNEKEMQRLEECGLNLATIEDIPDLKGKKILFRAHGEPPISYKLTNDNNVEVLDASCGVVRNLQKKIAAATEEMLGSFGQVVVYGKHDHPEVVGLLGQTQETGILVRNVGELNKIDLDKPVRLFSQTTMDKDIYDDLYNILIQRMEDHNNGDLIRYNTICRHVLNRIPSLSEFAAGHDVIIFVSGRESSNGRKLFKICKGINERSHFISDSGELDPRWFTGVSSVGVSGAASTPQWLMEEVATKIEELN